MTLAEHILKYPADNGGLRVAADALLERGDEDGVLLTWFASLGAARSVLSDDIIKQQRLIQASNQGLILHGRRWSKKRGKCNCGGGNNNSRLSVSLNHFHYCVSLQDVCLYKSGRPLGDPTAPDVKYTYEQVFSVADREAWETLRIDEDETDVPANGPLFERALSLANEPDTAWARHIISQALKQEFRMVRNLASFAAYRLLQASAADPAIIRSMLRIAEEDADSRRRGWYSLPRS